MSGQDGNEDAQSQRETPQSGARKADGDAQWLRQLVRDELVTLAARAQPRERSNRIWTFLNSGFGLWILSSAVLTGVTAAYSNWSARIALEQETARHMAQLDAEVDLRFRRLLPTVLTAFAERPGGSSADSLKPVRNPVGLSDLSNLPLEDIFIAPNAATIYQRAYRDYSLLSIFAEAQSLARTEREKKGILLAIDRLESSRLYYVEAKELAAGKLPTTGRVRVTVKTSDGQFDYESFRDPTSNASEKVATREDDARSEFIRAQVATLRAIHTAQRSQFDRGILETYFFWKQRRDLRSKQVPGGLLRATHTRSW